MDLNVSASSADTDVLVKLPPDFFDPNFNEKTHFSNDQSFMKEIDKFLDVNNRKDMLNSTGTEFPSYNQFADTLQGSPNDQDLNLQLITIFQKKIQQLQSKISYLIKSNQEKEEMIRKLKYNEGLDTENSNLRKKIIQQDQEIAETISLIKRYETKNEMLELKIENLTSTSKEMSEISRMQIQELETRLSNSLKNEKELQKQIEEMKEQTKEEKEKFTIEKQEKCKLDREIIKFKEIIKKEKNEKVQILEKFDKDRLTLEEKQKKIFTSMMDDFTDKERKLIKELDAQRAALKNYYQAQLEASLEEKVKEYQDQLNKFQADIQHDAEERERCFNERSINQMEQIIRKNEEEIDLITRKCKEEVDLYRIQLMNANKCIENLEIKLGEYQMRRLDIADNLHTIMESQWKKILDVLSCPSRPPSQLEFRMNTNQEDEEISESDNNKQFQQINNFQKMNNLSRSEENLKSELLRNYIDKVSEILKTRDKILTNPLQLLKQQPKTKNDQKNRNCFNEESSSTTTILRPSSSTKSQNNRPWK